ncbi:MAG: metal ABC transporter ATP-binding protein [Proteobacteria bacterium]|jgi:ABC-type Mn2+/Zn2+ transport system ATPase subunit|nr:metal ABC transporter ATP-binding protein [Pseudomonadota bacterium]
MSDAVTGTGALVRLQGVSIGYGGRALLAGISFSIDEGDTLALVGPNGAGKTTLVATMLGTLRPVAGTVARRPGLTVGFVPQRGRHDPIFALTARDVAAMGAMGAVTGRRLPRLGPAARDATERALEELGVGPLAGEAFRDLSGGQQQRVLIARALVRDPALLVLDEPTAGMDVPSERDLLDLVTGLASTRRTAVVLVTHQLALAAERASRIAIVNKDGGLFALGEARDIMTSERLSAAYGRAMEVVGTGDALVVRPTGGGR